MALTIILVICFAVIGWSLFNDVRFLCRGFWFRNQPLEYQEYLKQNDPDGKWELNHGRPLSRGFIIFFFAALVAAVATLSVLSSIGWIPNPEDLKLKLW